MKCRHSSGDWCGDSLLPLPADDTPEGIKKTRGGRQLSCAAGRCSTPLLSAAQKFDFYPTQGIVDGFKLKPIEVENVAAAAQLIFIKDYDY